MVLGVVGGLRVVGVGGACVLGVGGIGVVVVVVRIVGITVIGMETTPW